MQSLFCSSSGKEFDQEIMSCLILTGNYEKVTGNVIKSPGAGVDFSTKMTSMKQIGLLAAGCQPWNRDVCAANGNRFAYCATLAIYIYQVSRHCKVVEPCEVYVYLVNGSTMHVHLYISDVVSPIFKGTLLMKEINLHTQEKICRAISVLICMLKVRTQAKVIPSLLQDYHGKLQN